VWVTRRRPARGATRHGTGGAPPAESLLPRTFRCGPAAIGRICGPRAKSLEKAVFFSGYGVEIGLLIDVFEQRGLRTIAQVDLLERIHRNQGLEALSKMSFAIIQVVLRKLESRYERAMVRGCQQDDEDDPLCQMEPTSWMSRRWPSVSVRR